MGSLLQGRCKCGYEAGPIQGGGGKATYKYFCGAPALCPQCKKLVTVNYLEDTLECPSCNGPVTVYDDPSLQDPDITPSGTVFSWNMTEKTLVLPMTKYRCPQCGQFGLEFEEIGFFD